MFVGIDPALGSTGLVMLWPNGQPSYSESIRPAGNQTGLVRVRDIRHQIMRAIKLSRDAFPDAWERAGMVAIETVAFSKMAFTVAQLTELGTALRLALHDAGLPYWDISPSQVHAFVGFKKPKGLKDTKANRLKLKPHAEVKAAWGFEHESGDVIDAYVMAQAMRTLPDLKAATSKQREVLMGLRQGMV